VDAGDNASVEAHVRAEADAAALTVVGVSLEVEPGSDAGVGEETDFGAVAPALSSAPAGDCARPAVASEADSSGTDAPCGTPIDPPSFVLCEVVPVVTAPVPGLTEVEVGVCPGGVPDAGTDPFDEDGADVFSEESEALSSPLPCEVLARVSSDESEASSSPFLCEEVVLASPDESELSSSPLICEEVALGLLAG
jgi:hypothetical protein